jgi:hypothetical protein
MGFAVAVLLLSVAGCGGGARPGVDNLGETTIGRPTAGSPEGSKQANALEYSRCMRAHGIPNFPDPNSKGEISLSDQPDSPGYVNPASPAFGAAQSTCAKVSSFKASPTPTELRNRTAALLRFARCVRAQGIPAFPDPSSLGPNQGVGFLINRNVLDPHSPVVESAVTACQRVVSGISFAFKSYG